MAIKKILLLLLIFFIITSDISAEIKSLKNNKTNVRLGPDISYPIKWKYKKKYLPVQIIDKHYNWRKIKDFENDTGWIHISQLSNKKTVISIVENVLVFSKPTIFESDWEYTKYDANFEENYVDQFENFVFSVMEGKIKSRDQKLLQKDEL